MASMTDHNITGKDRRVMLDLIRAGILPNLFTGPGRDANKLIQKMAQNDPHHTYWKLRCPRPYTGQIVTRIPVKTESE